MKKMKEKDLFCLSFYLVFGCGLIKGISRKFAYCVSVLKEISVCLNLIVFGSNIRLINLRTSTYFEP